jgi:hypothetical protein
MNGNQETALSTVVAEAKQRALRVIEANPGCVSYVKSEDLETQSLFVPIVSVIKPKVEEFHDLIPGIGIMAKVPLMNTIREKAGVNIHHTETTKRGEYVWVAHCFGDKRQPDGTMLAQDAAYEFDAEKRAELDFINQPDKYKNEILKRKHVLELCKFGAQKAVTGAQLALIHKLAKIPPSFKTPEELMRGMIVCRIDRNVNGILADPRTRRVATQLAFGASDTIYGPQERRAISADVGAETPVEEVHEPPAAEPVDEDPFGEKEAAAEKEAAQKEMDPKTAARLTLEEWLLSDILKKSAKEVIRAQLADKDITLEALQNTIKRCNDFEERVRVKAAGGKK